MRHALLLALVLVPLLGPPAAAGGGDPATVRIPFADPLPQETDHFGLYLGREKVGWGLLSLHREGGAEGHYVSRSHFVADVRGPGLSGSLDFESEDVFRGQPPYDLLESREQHDDGEVVRTVMLKRSGPGYVAVREVDGVAEEVRLEDIDYTLVDRLTNVEWIRRLPVVGARIAVAELDISNLRQEVHAYEVLERGSIVASASPVETFRVSMHSVHRGHLGTALFGSHGRLLEGPIGGRLKMRLESEAQARDLSLASPLFAFGRAPVVEPLGRAADVSQLVLGAFGPGARDLPLVGRGALTWLADVQEARITVVPARGPGPTATPEGIEEARRVQAAVIESPRRLRALADEAVGDARAVEERIQRLLAFTRGFLGDAWAPYEPTVAQLLREPAGDATEHGRLFLALAGSLGITARSVVGLLYLGDDVQAFGAHLWCEVLVEGCWQEVDPTLNLRHATAMHIPFEHGSSDLVGVSKRSRHLQFELRTLVRSPDGR